MNELLLLCLLAPLGGALFIGASGLKNELAQARITIATNLTYGVAVAMLLTVWALDGFGARTLNLGSIYHNNGRSIDLVFYLDRIGAVFLAVTAYLSAIVIRFSRYYMHREEGYKRFFVTVFCFVFGMNLLILSGTIELLFAGWEIVGIASFLLIGFYQRRRTPLRNAFRVYVIYRLCDVGVLLGAWLSHMLWPKSHHFSELVSLAASGQIAATNPTLLLAFSLLILVAAAGKSAQYPFCGWLPRAMEGPTPSSAIFYGALSVHAGVFLLLRMYPLWHASEAGAWLVGVEGVVTVIYATICGRAQANIKGQIAYASITQVGLILIELALGFPDLALAHFVGNAGLRCYQLLVSPSIVVYLLKMHSHPRTLLKVFDWSFERLLPRRWRSTFYAIALKEGIVFPDLGRLAAERFRRLGLRLSRSDYGVRWRILLTLVTLLVGAWLAVPESTDVIAAIGAVLMLFVSLIGLLERLSARTAWHAVGFSSVLTGLIVVMVDGYLDRDVILYFAGVVPGWIGGILILRSLAVARRVAISLENHHGFSLDRPHASILLLLAFLTLAAFPIGPAFLGEDLLLQHVVGKFAWLAPVLMACFVMNGIDLARIYSRVCLGPEPRKAALQWSSAYSGDSKLEPQRLELSQIIEP